MFFKNWRKRKDKEREKEEIERAELEENGSGQREVEATDIEGRGSGQEEIGRAGIEESGFSQGAESDESGSGQEEIGRVGVEENGFGQRGIGREKIEESRSGQEGIGKKEIETGESRQEEIGKTKIEADGSGAYETGKAKIEEDRSQQEERGKREREAAGQETFGAWVGTDLAAGSEAEPGVQEEAADKKKKKEKKGFFSRLVKGLTKTRDNIVSGIDSIFSSFSSIDDDFYEEIEEILVMGDLGIHATTEIIENLKKKVKEQHIKEPAACKELLISSIKEQMDVGETAYRFEDEKSVVLVIGVNGVGKTTSVGKLAGKLKDQGKKVVIAAADTFRAAAGEQLAEWANRAGVEMIGGQEGADPAAVVYDAVAAAKARNADVLLCDTAGRLHNKKNLMEELKKIHRILEKEYPDAFRETLVVLDGTTGQNALAQAKQFSEVADITGIVLTKMDGTAKGGIAVAIQSELGVPVKYIGVGETIDDLQKFDSGQFVNALFATEEEKEEQA